MRYIMPCLMPPPILAYHRELVDLVAERFGLTFMGETDGMDLWAVHRSFNLEA